MRSFDFEVVTRLLDLVAANFDNVVIDVPRTWFAWTDSVLIGSNRLFLVTEMTVPGLKHARHLVNVIHERLPDGPKLEVIVNRFEQRLFGPGPAPRRHRAGARQLARRHDPEQFPPGERGDRPRRAARRGEGRQQHRHLPEQADLPAEKRQRRRNRSPASASSRWHAESTHVRPFHRIETHRRGRGRRDGGRARASAVCRRSEAPSLQTRAGAAEARAESRSPRLRSRRCATSCSTPRCGCIAG